MTDYFALYGIPRTFAPDLAQVKKKYYELSRKFHPDRVSQQDATAQTEALLATAANNEAYRLLTNPDATMAYLLQLHGVMAPEEKYALPPEFLMDMMELNELLDEAAENVDARRRAQETLDEAMRSWEVAVGPELAAYERGDQSEEQLLRVKDFYFRKKYLLRIQERITTFALP